MNGYYYCFSEYEYETIVKMNAFTNEEVLEIRKGTITFDRKLNVIALLSTNIVENKVSTSQIYLTHFL